MDLEVVTRSLATLLSLPHMEAYSQFYFYSVRQGREFSEIDYGEVKIFEMS